MKNQIYSLLILVIVFMTSACEKECHTIHGSGPLVDQFHPVQEFSGVDYQLEGRVNIIPDSFYSISIRTYANYQSTIHTRVIDGILVIESNSDLVDDDITVDIHTPILDYLNVDGSAKIYTTGDFYSSSMEIKVNGSGSADYSGHVNSLNSNISGSGKIALTGTATNATLKISGSGRINGYSLMCNTNHSTISGSGCIQTNVSDNLHVKISGSGDVMYMGYPSVSTDISGSGNVVHVQ